MYSSRAPRSSQVAGAVLLAWLAGCAPISNGDVATAGPADDDDDGFDVRSDCDDSDAAVYPGATEQCNEVDDDCDAEVDEDVVDATIWFADADADGHGVPTQTATGCTAPPGHAATSDDCDDSDEEVYPSAPEICWDGVLQNCDGDIDADRAGCPFDGELLGAAPSANYSGRELSSLVGMAGDLDGNGTEEILVLSDTSFAVIGAGEAPAFGDLDAWLVVGGTAMGAAPAGDFDGDGLDDLAVSTLSDADTVYLLSGPLAQDTTLDAASRTWSGPTAHTTIVGRAGDVDGDGTPDLLLRTQREGNGAAAVLRGGADELADAADALTAESVELTELTGIGDMDGDGLDEIAAAYPADRGEGYVLVGWGAGATGDAWLPDGETRYSYGGTDADDSFGFSLARTGDVNADGYSDLAIGYSEGLVGVFPGGAERPEVQVKDDTLDAVHVDHESGAVELVGSPGKGAPLADFNHDGYIDLLAWESDDASIYFGSEGGEFPNHSSIALLESEADPGAFTDDLDGDGSLDVALARRGDLLLYYSGGGI